MNITLLPVELVHLMMENLKTERSSLHALTLTSKALRQEATRFLYQSMTDTSGTCHYKFLLNIRRHPAELAPLVRTYHTPTGPHEQRGHLWGLIRRCLLLMVNLKELAFRKIIGDPVHIFPYVGKGQKMLFQLDKFIWMVQSDTYRKPMQTFLETQNELAHVEWVTSQSVILSCSAQASPKLKSLEGSTSTIRVLLPSRSITELYWFNEWPLYLGAAGGVPPHLFRHDVLEVLEMKEFAALRGLSLKDKWIWDSVIMHPGFKASSSLEVLEIPSLFDDYLGHQIKLNWTTLRAVLPKFPHLKKLVVTMPTPFTQFPNKKEDPTSEIGQIFGQCLHLKCVDILWNHDLVYRRWVDGETLPTLLSIKRDRILKFE
ncbi:hypothetical protein GALMADRAFT_153593 [Galerina marginata CBS 339.88]|uniref:F-box domain-containing protein n=1 Tax=Galerina marginata (strain CBS 339.88) TaxID=685588 RepID=A0A067TBW8_GALM3|nr:hypothetical protein GALMADRAFT_153593 [Galerina marginata CBS 339.88]